MAVFWFGWGKKVKNALTKKQADSLYLPKTFETEINEFKRLTKLNTIKPTNTMAGNGNLQIPLNPKIDYTRPLYIGFEKWDNSNNSLVGSYTIVVIIANDNRPRIYNNINDIKLYCLDSKLFVSGWNFQSNIVFKKFNIQYTPKTLTTTINETQEEGE